MQKKVIIFTLLVTASCTFLSESKGLANEIIVISSQEDKILIEPLLKDIFTNIVHTPQPEEMFTLIYKDPWELESYDKYGNIILISLNFPKDSSGDLLTQRILTIHKQKAELLILGDLYAKNQIFCVINALDIIAFENIIKNNRTWILDEYNTQFDKKLKEEVYKNGKNNDLSKKILQILEYTVDLQPDFKLIKSDSLRSFVWIGRGYPYRWITLHKSQKDSYAKIKSSWDQLGEDYSLHLPDIEISEYFQKNEKVSIGNNQILVMRGIYEHSQAGTGGPFFVYIFETEQSNEVILVSGFINYPGHEKILLLKQLEIIAKTLHKGEPS